MRVVLSECEMSFSIIGRTWSGEWPIAQLDEKLEFYRRLLERKGGKYAAVYRETFDGLVALRGRVRQ